MLLIALIEACGGMVAFGAVMHAGKRNPACHSPIARENSLVVEEAVNLPSFRAAALARPRGFATLFRNGEGCDLKQGSPCHARASFEVLGPSLCRGLPACTVKACSRTIAKGLHRHHSLHPGHRRKSQWWVFPSPCSRPSSREQLEQHKGQRLMLGSRFFGLARL